jgi:PAS domain S-box-containing protein
MGTAMRTNPRPIGRPGSWLLRYGLALLSVAVALATTRAFPENAQIRGPLFIPAILVSAWYGGIGPGLLATGLSVVAIDYFLLVPTASLKFRSIDDAVYLVAFLLSALLVAWLTGSQRRAELEVRRQAGLLDLTHDSVFVRDMDNVITYWNRGAAERYGWSPTEAIGTVSHQLLKTAFPEPLDQITADLNRTGRWDGELVHTRRDGTRLRVASRWALQRDERGRPVDVLETNNDISELEAARTELARVARVTMLGELASSIAHEINQPLAAVTMNGNACRRWLAADPPNVEEARSAAQRVVSDATRAGQVIARIRALVRRETPQRTPLDVNDLIGETIAFTRGEISRHGATLAQELADDLPPAVADRVQLQQVLVNLILNGLDAMNEVTERSRVLTIRTARADSDGVAIEVRDSGKGIDPVVRDRIFEPFYSTKSDGLGMGLAISRSIVEQHGGTIQAMPGDGAGVTMRFTLPTMSGGA